MCLKGIELRAQNLLTILNSQHNGGGGTPIWAFNEHENLHFHNEEDIHWAPKNTRQMATSMIWI